MAFRFNLRIATASVSLCSICIMASPPARAVYPCGPGHQLAPNSWSCVLAPESAPSGNAANSATAALCAADSIPAIASELLKLLIPTDNLGPASDDREGAGTQSRKYNRKGLLAVQKFNFLSAAMSFNFAAFDAEMAGNAKEATENRINAAIASTAEAFQDAYRLKERGDFAQASAKFNEARNEALSIGNCNNAGPSGPGATPPASPGTVANPPPSTGSTHGTIGASSPGPANSGATGSGPKGAAFPSSTISVTSTGSGPNGATFPGSTITSASAPASPGSTSGANGATFPSSNVSARSAAPSWGGVGSAAGSSGSAAAQADAAALGGGSAAGSGTAAAQPDAAAPGGGSAASSGTAAAQADAAAPGSAAGSGTAAAQADAAAPGSAAGSGTAAAQPDATAPGGGSAGSGTAAAQADAAAPGGGSAAGSSGSAAAQPEAIASNANPTNEALDGLFSDKLAPIPGGPYLGLCSDSDSECQKLMANSI